MDDIPKLGSQWAHLQGEMAVLIFESDKCVVFLRRGNLEVDWLTTTAHDEWLETQGVDKTDCQSRVSYLESLPIRRISESTRRAIQCQLGEATAACLRAKPEKAAAILDRAEEFILARNLEYARSRYIFAIFVTAFVTVSIAAGIERFRSRFQFCFDPKLVFDVIIGGALGTFLFAMAGMSQLKLDPEGEASSHALDAVTRVIVGMIGALMVYCSVKGHLLLPKLIDEPDNNYGLFLLCMLGGASERLAGSAVAVFDDLVTKKIARSPAKKSAPASRPAHPPKANSAKLAISKPQTPPQAGAGGNSMGVS